MKFLLDGRFFRFLVGLFVCAIALVLPYRARMQFNKALSFVIHTPFVLFGFVARALLQKLDIFPEAPGDRK